MNQPTLLDKIHAALMSGQPRTTAVDTQDDADLGPVAASMLAARLDLKLTDITFVVQPRTDDD